jgi:hypothetical protein
MHPLIEMANHLIAAALAEGGAAGPVRVRSCVLDDAGIRLSVWLDHPGASGEARLNVLVAPTPGAAPGRHTVRIAIERWPERLPGWVEPLRRILERAKLNLELDFQR